MDEWQERLERAYAELDPTCDDRYFEIKGDGGRMGRAFCGWFGLEQLDYYFPGMNYHFKRVGDQQIEHRVMEMLREGRKPRILEVGAGSTFAKPRLDNYLNFGAPWLSRRLAKAFGDVCTIIATDINPDTVYDESDNSPAFRYFALQRTTKRQHTFLSTGYVTNVTVGELTADGRELARKLCVSELANGRMKPVDSIVPDFFAHRAHDPPYQNSRNPINYQWHVRPVVDSQVEKELFGLDFRGRIDGTKLKDYFPPNSFDLIFFRNFGWVLKSDNIEDVCGPVLASGGEVRIGADTRCREPIFSGSFASLGFGILDDDEPDAHPGICVYKKE